MRLGDIIWIEEVVEKLASKHGVETHEVREVLDAAPRIRFCQKGSRKAEDVYEALGRTHAGRYLTVLFIRKADGRPLILSARDMMRKERKRYEQK